MIQARELRIGSLFHPVDRSGTIQPATGLIFKIVELKAFTVSAVLFDENPAQVETWPEFQYSDLSPIQLTPDILSKCGFNRSRDGWYISSNHKIYDPLELGGSGNMVQVNRECYLLLNNDKIIDATPIRHLHQLQNLYYCLTGQEIIYQP